MIDSKHLKLILAIDKMGSLSKASNELNLSQSALSHQLKNLEEYLGLELFHRTGNQLFFTEAGKELKEKAKNIINELDILERRMKELKENQLARYIHGYSQREAQRLLDQASSVSEYLHFDSNWEAGSKILEVGCGVGAQTIFIAHKNPKVQFLSIDISEKSIELAKSRIKSENIHNVDFRIQDVKTIDPKKDGKFDHIFVCFLLEHLIDPVEVLSILRTVLKPNGTITVIEGDHGSTFFYPENDASKNLVNAQVALQQKRGGNANIGRQLYPLLSKAGFKNIEVSPRQIYVDNSKSELVESFIKNTFTAMIKGMSQDIIGEDLLSKEDVKLGIQGLLRTAETDGVFSYTFFKAKASV